MRIAIVILNWNGLQLLQEYLPVLIRESEGADVWVIDNASTDLSVKWLHEKHPSVQVVVNKENYGFAGGYNVGLKNIKADVYCLLNSDVLVSENWLTPIRSLLESRDDITIVQPKVKDLKKPTHFEYAGAAGGFIDKMGYPFCRGRIFQSLEEDTGQYDDNQEIFWATGACMFIRSNVFWQLDGFDPLYFAHQEEIDLCWRAKNKGYKVYYCGASEVFHLGGSTLQNSNPRKTYLNFRNSLFSLIKNLPLSRSLPIVLGRLFLDFFAGIRFLTQLLPGHTWAIVRAHFSFYRHFFTVYRKREVHSSFDPSKNYFKVKSIVWSHFVNGVTKFNELVKD